MLTEFGVNGVLFWHCGDRDEERERGVLSFSGDSMLNETASDTRFKRHLLAYLIEWYGNDPGGSASVGQTEWLARQEARFTW
ncbi:hypothetical protein [Corynebacterium minutissimum]|uniref:Uncharacterized protein n=1 Tax=Corynebacterium minutissimum TaxID=38301 RepID=A0A2X4RT92_9CORY|nr:hypothetical protein [Corynebacterium minutissimum]KHO29840.1 hypothetical protein NX84_05050 [Corynebacterium minutissimum]QPS60672.1 hypothetical protein I6G51_05740 [Corynebacterium minutissimum]QQA78541.1 hypothetical protein I6H49_07115 [Corynebacterium minutissimum]SQI00442.1 Uncharacterised protein [Corynebacterium minutissimum]VEG05490.1 Uncharacterised protein [Corynebacterium minutissimum]